jgi:flagellar biosynthesis protein FlhF
MQVKKFEAQSIKEALEMVKNDLGPEAIILAVRDNVKRFGLAGEGSVEVTAAVSDLTLRKKQFTESKLNNRDRESFTKSSAHHQKRFIDKMVHNHTERKSAPEVQIHRQVTARPYIEITDDQQMQQSNSGRVQAMGGRNVTDMLNEVSAPPAKRSEPNPAVALQRIRSAARDAWDAVQDTVEVHKPARRDSPPPPANPAAEREIQALRNEISGLKRVIEDFKSVPQKFVSFHPGAEVGIPYEMSFMYEKLANAGISSVNIHAILLEAQKELPIMQIKKKAMVDAWVAQHLLKSIQVQAEPLTGRVHLFVGGSGQGKTAMLVKMASHLIVEKRKRIAIVTTDSFKVGAVEQLRIYSLILNIPFVVIREQSEWPKVLAQLANVDHILADFAGLQLKDTSENDLIRRLLPPPEIQAHIHFVVAATLKDSDAFELARRYQVTRFQDVIFTCIDESIQHGLIYNFQKEFSSPLHSFGIGARIPEDFEEASKERVLDLIFKLSKNWTPPAMAAR